MPDEHTPEQSTPDNAPTATDVIATFAQIADEAADLLGDAEQGTAVDLL